MVIWITGLSGSGKTTLARELKKKLKNAILIDGDLLRKKYPCGFSIEERRENIERAISLAEVYSSQNKNVIVALTSPFLDQRIKARKKFKNFIEIYLKCPVEVCAQRKPEIYQAKRNIVGRDIEYQENPFAEIVIESHKISKKEALKKVISLIQKF